MEVPSEIKTKYLERRKHDLEVCLSSLINRQFDEIEKIGHQLKGNGATFGHPEISQIGKKLEDAAKFNKINEIEIALKELSMWVSAIH